MAFKRWLIAIKCARKYSPHYYTTTTRLDCWHKAGWVHGFMLLVPNSDPTICMPQQKSRFIWPGYVFPIFNCPVLVSLCPLQPQLSVLGLQKWNPMWSSVVVAYLPQGPICCVFRDAFLLTTIVQSGYSFTITLVSQSLAKGNACKLIPLLNHVEILKKLHLLLFTLDIKD